MAVVRATSEQDELKRSAMTLAEEAERFQVVDAQTYEAAAEFLKGCTKREREIKSVMEPIVKAANLAHREACAQQKALLEPIETARRVVSRLMGDYQAEQERIRRAAEAAERERLKKEAEEAIEAGALELEAEGRGEEAAELMSQALECIQEPTIEKTAPKVKGTAVVTVWDFRVVNAFLVPRQYLCLDEKKIRETVKREKENTSIPGIEAFSTTNVHVRG